MTWGDNFNKQPLPGHREHACMYALDFECAVESLPPSQLLCKQRDTRNALTPPHLQPPPPMNLHKNHLSDI